MTVGDILKDYRKKNKISQDKFSDKSGISKGYISMLENNTNARNNKPIAPTIEMLKKIAFGMDIGLDELLVLTDGKQKISLTDESQITKDKADERLRKIIDCYNNMNRKGKQELADQAEYLSGKYSKQKTTNTRAM